MTKIAAIKTSPEVISKVKLGSNSGGNLTPPKTYSSDNDILKHV
jgi:hypothetical protein